MTALLALEVEVKVEVDDKDEGSGGDATTKDQKVDEICKPHQ